jgi:hypothetical protein
MGFSVVFRARGTRRYRTRRPHRCGVALTPMLVPMLTLIPARAPCAWALPTRLQPTARAPLGACAARHNAKAAPSAADARPIFPAVNHCDPHKCGGCWETPAAACLLLMLPYSAIPLRLPYGASLSPARPSGKPTTTGCSCSAYRRTRRRAWRCWSGSRDAGVDRHRQAQTLAGMVIAHRPGARAPG